MSMSNETLNELGRMENYHEWTACEVYGHDYQEEPKGRHYCLQCGDAYYENEEEGQFWNEHLRELTLDSLL